MKEDKDLLKELLKAKFKDDVVQSSTDSFDRIFDAVQEKSDDKSSFFWYTVGVIVLMLIGVVTLYYLKNNKATLNLEETNTETPAQIDTDNVVTYEKDTLFHKKEENKIVTIENESQQNSVISEKEFPLKKVDVTTLRPEDEIIEKGVITVTYKASDKYASTANTKYNRLPDSSTIVVRKNSKVNFTATRQGYRRADVTGTIFFNIKSNVSEPFIVFGKHCKIQITGNSFAIHSDISADLMTLIEGSAKVVHNTTKEVRDLVPGESLYADKQGMSSLEKSPNRFAWKTGILHYEDTSIQEIINDLRENYDAKILLKNAELLNCKYSGFFKNASTTKVLTSIVNSLDLQLSKKEHIFIIDGKNCDK